jgi:hypothetical protein
MLTAATMTAIGMQQDRRGLRDAQESERRALNLATAPALRASEKTDDFRPR